MRNGLSFVGLDRSYHQDDDLIRCCGDFCHTEQAQ